MDSLSIERATCKEKRQQLNDFYKLVAECRPDLFKFCRKLTGNPWDAEDLVQDTLMTAYGRLADKHAGIQNIKSYLFKVASNQWISWCRRSKFSSIEGAATEPSYENDMYAVQDSLSTLLRVLPPKERVALVLSDVFESKNDEIAEMMGNTEGAVKSALVRAREKVKNMAVTKSSMEWTKNPDHEKVLGLAVDAFNRRDLDGFARLFAANAVSQAPGCFFETGREEIKNGSLFHTVNTFEGQPQPASFRAEPLRINGETFFAIFDGANLDDVWKFVVEEGEILRFDCYYCCPDVLAEVAGIIGTAANHHGYWFEQGPGHL